jgi:hypothetical protein
MRVHRPQRHRNVRFFAWEDDEAAEELVCAADRFAVSFAACPAKARRFAGVAPANIT